MINFVYADLSQLCYGTKIAKREKGKTNWFSVFPDHKSVSDNGHKSNNLSNWCGQNQLTWFTVYFWQQIKKQEEEEEVKET